MKTASRQPASQAAGDSDRSAAPSVAVRQARSPASGWAIAAVLAVIAVIVYIIRYALLPFVFAIAIAFVVEPLVVRLQRWTGGRRSVAAVIVYAAMLAIIAAATYLIGLGVVSDLLRFTQLAPASARQLIVQIAGPQISVFGASYTPDEIVREIAHALSGTLGVGVAARAAGAGFAALFGGFLMLALIASMMVSGPGLARGAIWLIPPERRRSVELLLPKIIPALRRYLVGLVVVVTYTATAAWIGFGPIFHLPHAVLLAVAVGVLELVPIIGPFASGALVALTAFQQHSLATVITLIAFAIVLRLTIDNLVGPLVLGKAGRLHPVVVMFAFVSGAMLFGVIGLLLAVPAAVCIRIVLQHYYAEPIRTGEGG